MPDQDAQNPNIEPANVDTDPVDETGDPEGADALGDPGKKALDAMKEKWRKERDARKALADELAKLKAQLESSDDQVDLDEVRRQAAAEATAKLNARVLRSEVKAAAAGLLADPEDALYLLDLDRFKVGDDGEVDTKAIKDAISDLIARKPYLAAQGGTVQFDSARGKRAPVGQLTREELSRMTPAEINEARRAGRLNSLLGRT